MLLNIGEFIFVWVCCVKYLMDGMYNLRLRNKMKKKIIFIGKNFVWVFVYDFVICLYLELVELVVSFEIELMNVCIRYVWYGM